ncbi:protein HEADING DATE 3B-like [Magnolia sinica]|uniref:protein HEADING DATE 3B-like n=1 Tax=Magnolia sinica TaxID=86752 RepID=UPI00265AFC2D|nr:protein HEADING DATE 3B-like [Magnolia sinica]
MKGGKDEDKVMGPLFPRLHVSDADKGGPRAPPRNKMALYEQLSIPSQRSNSAGSLGLPPKHRITSKPVGSFSIIKSCRFENFYDFFLCYAGGGHERSMFSPFYIPSPIPAHSTEKVLPRSSFSDVLNSNAKRMELEGNSIKSASYRALSIRGHFLSTAESSSIRSDGFSNSKNFCRKKVRDEDDFRVPTNGHLGTAPNSSKDQQSGGRERTTHFTMYPGHLTVTATNSPQKSAPATCNSSFHLHNTLNMPLKRTDTTDLKLRQHGRHQIEQKRRETIATKDYMEKSASTGEKNAEPSKHAPISLNPEHCGSVNENDNAWLLQEASARLLPKNICGRGVSVEPRCFAVNAVSEQGNVSKFRSDSYSRASLRDSHRSPNEPGNCNGESEERAYRSLRLEDVDRNDDVSETSMLDSMSGLDITPDDVVGVMGQKHFWKARRAIANQQRVFAVQVFELHRLIKVQKLIAGSPHLMLEDYPYLGKQSTKVPTKKLPSDYIVKSQLHISKPKDDSQKPSQSTGCPTESAGGKPPLPPVNGGVRNGLSQISSPGNPPPPAAVAADNKPGPWCFHPPGNQWLVPIMSPSEGLVYKPYTGPCPPTGSFMAPVYSGCGPVSVPPVPAYGVLASHQQPGVGVISGAPAVAPNYFPSYGLPVVNPVIPTSSVEHVNPLGGAQPHGQAEQISTRDVTFNMQSGSSCNLANQNTESFSCCVRKIQTSKGSEVQGSTASSPSDWEKRASHVVGGRDVLPLFPMAQLEGSGQTQHAHSTDQQASVIKVVPHNPRSATESAARIFQSIQQERQQYDSL